VLARKEHASSYPSGSAKQYNGGNRGNGLAPETPRSPSPFSFGGLVQPQQQQQHSNEPTPQEVPENNRERTFRRAGNICEIVGGASLNSAVIFTFHLLQVHPIGMFLALGVAHLYFTATAAGEPSDKRVTNIMTGASASLALLCSLSEPLGEAWETHTTQGTFHTTLDEFYTPPKQDSTGGIIAVIAALVLIFARQFLQRGKPPQRTGSAYEWLKRQQQK
jgi:hypothetical protein